MITGSKRYEQSKRSYRRYFRDWQRNCRETSEKFSGRGSYFCHLCTSCKKANEFWDSLKPEDQEKLIILKADMSSYEEMMAFVTEVKEKAGHVDWLVSNAGISTYDKFQDYTFGEWNNIVNTNLSIPVFMVKELMPVMTEGGSVLLWVPMQDARRILLLLCTELPRQPFIS